MRPEDPLAQLIAAHKGSGLGLYYFIRIECRLRREPKIELTTVRRYGMNELDIPEEGIEVIIATCLKLGLLGSDNMYVWPVDLLQRWADRQKQAERDRENGRRGAIIRWRRNIPPETKDKAPPQGDVEGAATKDNSPPIPPTNTIPDIAPPESSPHKGGE